MRRKRTRPFVRRAVISGSLNEAGLRGDQFKLYDLIWKRTIATQMSKAELEFTNVTIEAKAGGQVAEFKANGKKIIFPGFFRAYVEGSDDPDAALENQEKFLPEMNEGDEVDEKGIEPISHETQPPSRYTEATLVKELEKRGVGRPSTYASYYQYGAKSRLCRGRWQNVGPDVYSFCGYRIA
ncbi:MAG: DNA topoisomerase [Fodinibius sp.]|nr:DNA topoisomerase [Fodinibius sp.]